MARRERKVGKTKSGSKSRAAGSSNSSPEKRSSGAKLKGGAVPGKVAKRAGRGRPARDQVQLTVRRDEILKAALTVFSRQGFEAARLDEVAQRAGVAKGTLYLYFPDKQAMFEALVQTAAAPVVTAISRLATDHDLAFGAALEKLYQLFVAEILATDRKLVLRLILAEGPRFPRIAAFYHREILSRIQDVLRTLARRAFERGELPNKDLVRFPHLVAAPLLLSLIWDGLFQHIEPLDVETMLDVYRGILVPEEDAQ